MNRGQGKKEGALARQMADRGVFDPDEFDAWLCERGWAWQALDRGDYGLTMDDALVLHVFEDPVRWCETFLIEPRTGAPWKFFEYQKNSLRAWRQNVIHQDGAEVGKTREILCFVLWGQCTSMGLTMRRPWMLIGAPQQTHLDEIILAIEEQVGVQESGEAKGSLLSHFWLKPKRTPHMMQRFKTIPLGAGEKPGVGRVYYRPAGHDGEAFRGVHVNAACIMDEAAKLKRELQWSEFWRAAMPGCGKRVYSVPDGDRATGFFRLTQQAVPNLDESLTGWRLFHWPKTIMPEPYWSAARDLEFTRDFGGRQTPGYQRNVLGEWGDAENPVWSWDVLLPNVVDVPEYRAIKLVADHARNTLAIEVRRVELQAESNRKVGIDHWLHDTTVDLTPFTKSANAIRRGSMRELLRANLRGESRGVFWAGADLGESNDPTEIIISEELGPHLRDRVRICARGLPYHMQRELIFCLAELFGFLPHWGVDLGSAGTVVVKDLQTLDEYAAARFDETLTGYQFSNAVDCVDEAGETLIDASDDGTEKIIRAPAKHWASQCITARLQSVGYSMAYDTEVLNRITNHTARQGTKWPIYAKKDDHEIDARRMQMLRKLYDEQAAYPDVFSVGAHERRTA
ncbi:MAG TPA: hypothetical protein PLR28_03885 [Dokdonella sp.]|nr:hypothetical protein [Dokdonella sp.]